MGKRDAWLKIFPIPQMSKAVDALTDGWHEMATRPKPAFNHETHEPDLTFVMTNYLRNVISHKKRLLGYWSSEDNDGTVDYETGKIGKRTRTDIGYHWNNDKETFSVIFEFKKLDRYEQSRKRYYGEKGMLRFVTGTYGEKQPLAFMTGILLDDWAACVPPLRVSLQELDVSGVLNMCLIDGKLLQTPSALFPTKAAFDSEHMRDRDKAPEHGTIRIAHIFLPFGYSSPTRVVKRSTRKSLEDSGL